LQSRPDVVTVGTAVKFVVEFLAAVWMKDTFSEFMKASPAQSVWPVVGDTVILHRNAPVGFVPVRTKDAADGPLKRVQLDFVTR
jgi:hypothetical protein